MLAISRSATYKWTISPICEIKLSVLFIGRLECVSDNPGLLWFQDFPAPSESPSEVQSLFYTMAIDDNGVVFVVRYGKLATL